MSVGVRIPWKQAYELAGQMATDLEPLVARSKAVGSLRRRRPTVSDIEFLVEPGVVEADLFGGQEPDVQPVHDLAHRWGRVTKAGPRYVQVKEALGSDLTCELYIVAPPANWHCLLAIRTGPAKLGRVAVTLMQRRGFYHRDGRIVRGDGSEVPVNHERDFFKAAGLRYFPPHLRDEKAALQPMTTEGVT